MKRPLPERVRPSVQDVRVPVITVDGRTDLADHDAMARRKARSAYFGHGMKRPNRECEGRLRAQQEIHHHHEPCRPPRPRARAGYGVCATGRGVRGTPRACSWWPPLGQRPAPHHPAAGTGAGGTAGGTRPHEAGALVVRSYIWSYRQWARRARPRVFEPLTMLVRSSNQGAYPLLQGAVSANAVQELQMTMSDRRPPWAGETSAAPPQRHHSAWYVSPDNTSKQGLGRRDDLRVNLFACLRHQSLIPCSRFWSSS